MSGYPVVLDGSRLTALVVGGGSVATRKIRALLDAGAIVRVVAPSITPELRTMAAGNPRMVVQTESYANTHVADAMIVIAATDDPAANARIADDATRAHRFVNVVDASDLGTFVTPAVHRVGDLTIAVSAGRLPAAAVAVRDAVAERFDDRYAAAVATLRDLRERLLDSGARDEWQAISSELLGDRFCADVESGAIESKVAAWR